MKVLILGGNGYLGRTLQRYFEDCKILDFDENLTEPTNFLDYNINNIVNYDVVVDLLNPSNNFIACIYKDFFNKVLDKKKEMINILMENKTKYVLASSAYIYFNNNNYSINSATMSFDNYSNYLNNMEAIAENLENKLVIRLSSLMGVSHGYVKSGLFINELANNNIKTIYGGEQWRNFIHVKDASYLISDFIMHNKCGTVNLASCYNYQLKEFLCDNIKMEDQKDNISFSTQDFLKDYNFINIADTLQELKKFYLNNRPCCIRDKYKRILE